MEASKRTRSSGRRAGLDTAHVVQAALEIVDKNGWKALKLSDVAKALDVRPPSLYTHIGGIPGLRREIQMLALRKMESTLVWAVADVSGKRRCSPWRRATGSMLLSIRGFMKP